MSGLTNSYNELEMLSISQHQNKKPWQDKERLCAVLLVVAIEGELWVDPAHNHGHTILKEKSISCLVKLRLLQVIPLELGVQVGESLHTEVVKVGQLLHLIQIIISGIFCFLAHSTCSGVGLRSGVMLRSSFR